MREMSLCAEDQLLIGEDIRITVCEIQGNQVVLHIEYPDGSVVQAAGQRALAEAIA